MDKEVEPTCASAEERDVGRLGWARLQAVNLCKNPVEHLLGEPAQRRVRAHLVEVSEKQGNSRAATVEVEPKWRQCPSAILHHPHSDPANLIVLPDDSVRDCLRKEFGSRN